MSTQWRNTICLVMLLVFLVGCTSHYLEKKVNQDGAFQKHDLQEVFGGYQTTLKIRPNISEPQLRIVRNYLQQQKYTEAREALITLLKADPKNKSALNNLGYIYEDIFQDYKAAARQYEQVLEIDPRDLHALVRLGSVYKQLKKLDEAEWLLQKALVLYPKFARSERKDLHNYLGLVYLEKGETDKAKAEFLESLQLIPEESRVQYENVRDRANEAL